MQQKNKWWKNKWILFSGLMAGLVATIPILTCVQRWDINDNHKNLIQVDNQTNVKNVDEPFAYNESDGLNQNAFNQAISDEIYDFRQRGIDFINSFTVKGDFRIKLQNYRMYSPTQHDIDFSYIEGDFDDLSLNFYLDVDEQNIYIKPKQDTVWGQIINYVPAGNEGITSGQVDWTPKGNFIIFGLDEQRGTFKVGYKLGSITTNNNSFTIKDHIVTNSSNVDDFVQEYIVSDGNIEHETIWPTYYTLPINIPNIISPTIKKPEYKEIAKGYVLNPAKVATTVTAAAALVAASLGFGIPAAIALLAECFGNAWWIQAIKDKYDTTFNDDYDKFKNQVFLHTKTLETKNIFDFALTTISDAEKHKLESGKEGGVDWNLGDITNNTMPSLIRWTNDLKTLFDVEKIYHLLSEINKSYIAAEPQSGWKTVLLNFINAINEKNFESYEQIKNLYDRYTYNEFNSPSDFQEEINNLGNGFATVMQILNTSINNHHLTLITDSQVSSGKYDAAGMDVSLPAGCNIYYPYVYLSTLVKGVLASNNIVCDTSATLDGVVNNNQDLVLYNGTAAQLNGDIYRNALVETDSENPPLQSLILSNFRIQNTKTTKFLNANVDDFNIWNNQLNNIKIKWNALNPEYNGFAYANWTKNQDAIGLDLNKYLSQLVFLDNQQVGHQMWEFVDGENTKNIIFDTLRGKYEYLNGDDKIQVPIPCWLQSGRTDGTYKNEKASKWSDIYPINADSINDLINNQNLFDKTEWANAWSKFGIELDETDGLYPLIQPNQQEGTFYVVAKINNFIKSTWYKEMKEPTFNWKPPIVWINKSANAEQQSDGYFLIKLKACWNETYSFDIATLHKYNVTSAIDPSTSITDFYTNFYENVIKSKNEDGGLKYWKENIDDIKHNNFFISEGWKEHKWYLDTNAIWNDLLTGDLIGDLTIQKNAVQYFTKAVNEELIKLIAERYGTNSIEYLDFIKFANNIELFKSFLEQVDFNNNPTLINNVPFMFNQDLWANVDDFLVWYTNKNLIGQVDEAELNDLTNINNINNLLNVLSDEEKELFKNVVGVGAEEELTAQDVVDYYQNILNNLTIAKKWNNWFILNEENPELFTNAQIENMFLIINNFKINLFADKYVDITSVDYNADKALIKEQFDYYYNHSNLITVDNTNYQQWVNSIKVLIEEMDLSGKYQEETNQIFLEKFNYLLTDLVNKVKFEVGSDVNQNLLFTSIEELTNDPLVKMLFEYNEVDIEQAFVKEPLVINGSVVPNAYIYDVNKNYQMPFVVSQKYIDGVRYFTLQTTSGTMNMDVSLAMLQAMMNFYIEDKNGKKIYLIFNKVAGNNLSTDINPNNSYLVEVIDDFNNVKTQVDNTGLGKNGYYRKIKVEAILLVVVLPIVLLLLALLTWWLIKTKKRKTTF